jgi:hypothetical protein
VGHEDDVPEDLVYQVIAFEIAREVLGALMPDVVLRRDCSFCHFERVPLDNNHHPTCPYWRFFGPIA